MEKNNTIMDGNKYASLVQKINESSIKEVFQNDSSNYKEFLSFERRLFEEVLYANREKYLDLIRRFVNDETMLYYQFTKEYQDLYESDQAKLKGLKNNLNELLSIDLIDRPLKLSDLIGDLTSVYDYIIDVIYESARVKIEAVFRSCILNIWKTLPQ